MRILATAGAFGALLLSAGRADAQPRPAATDRGALTPGVLALTNVHVIPMTSPDVLRNVTVLIRDGRIVAMGPGTSVPVPAGATRVDGRGQYLIPGLADMHAHLFSDDAVPEALGADELGVMVANGITATRLMMGTPAQLRLRQAVASGEVLGPQLWLASPEFAGRAYGGAGFKGRAVPTAEAARAAVREVAAAGYDFIKITLFVGPEAYAAVTDEARKAGLPVVGHVDPSVGVPRALAAGQHIEHLDNYVEQVLADSAPMKESVSDRGVYNASRWLSLDYIDPAKIRRLAGETARSGTYTTPTLTIFKNAFGLGFNEAEVRQRPDFLLYPEDARRMWLTALTRYWANPAAEARRHRWVDTRNQLVRAIADSGGRIMAGSDAPEFLFAYGWTLHRELESLVTAGLTPYEALQAATVTPARFLGVSREWGTLEPGKRADLVLLSGNPLDDIRNTTRIEGVVVGGRWLDRPALDGLVRTAQQRVGGTP